VFYDAAVHLHHCAHHVAGFFIIHTVPFQLLPLLITAL
jgi:hypothetical protein